MQHTFAVTGGHHLSATLHSAIQPPYRLLHADMFLTAAHVVARVSGEVAEVEYHSPVSSALLGHAPHREQRVKQDDSMQNQWHAVFVCR